ncbi:helix-turn-helix transcriptional regulator [Streptomyces sp. NPDC001770]
MGRPEAPVSPGAPPALRTFAEGLRALRRAAGLNYRAMGRLAGLSSTTLSQAASGSRLPTEAVTTAYVKACGGDVQSWCRQRQEVELSLRVPEPRVHEIAAPAIPDSGEKPEFPTTRRNWQHNLAFAGTRAKSSLHRAWCKRLAAFLWDVGYEQSARSPLAGTRIVSGEKVIGDHTFVRLMRQLGAPKTHVESLRQELLMVLAEILEDGPADLPDRAEKAARRAEAVPSPGGVRPRRPELELVALPGEFIRELRRAIALSGKSFRELSKSSHIPASTISDITRPNKNGYGRLPSLDHVTQLLKACGVTPLEMTYYEQALRRVQKVELELNDRQNRLVAAGRDEGPPVPVRRRARAYVRVPAIPRWWLLVALVAEILAWVAAQVFA